MIWWLVLGALGVAALAGKPKLDLFGTDPGPGPAPGADLHAWFATRWISREGTFAEQVATADYYEVYSVKSGLDGIFGRLASINQELHERSDHAREIGRYLAFYLKADDGRTLLIIHGSMPKVPGYNLIGDSQSGWPA